MRAFARLSPQDCRIRQANACAFGTQSSIEKHQEKEIMKRAFACALAVLSLLVLALAAPAGEVTRAALQRQDIVLLQRVEDTARDVLATAERLSTFNRVPTEYSRECHVVQLESLKEAI